MKVIRCIAGLVNLVPRVQSVTVKFDGVVSLEDLDFGEYLDQHHKRFALVFFQVPVLGVAMKII